MKLLKYILSAAAFLVAIGSAFAFKFKASKNLFTVIRYEQVNSAPCDLISRVCTATSGHGLCAIQTGILRQLRTCSAPRETLYIFKPF